MRPVQIPCRFFRQVIDSAYLCRTCIDDIKKLCCLFIYIYDIFVILSERGSQAHFSPGPQRRNFVAVGGGWGWSVERSEYVFRFCSQGAPNLPHRVLTGMKANADGVQASHALLDDRNQARSDLRHWGHGSLPNLGPAIRPPNRFFPFQRPPGFPPEAPPKSYPQVS